ncbi:MAG: hypothetical protein ACREXG_10335 [Polaromonas sp.]
MPAAGVGSRLRRSRFWLIIATDGGQKIASSEAAEKQGACMLPAVILAAAITPFPQELEQAFWNCDYISAHKLLSATEMGECLMVYENLKADKFNGDSQEFVKWWQANKPTEHAKRSKAN